MEDRNVLGETALGGNRERCEQGQQRTKLEEFGARAASCSGRTQPRIEQNRTDHSLIYTGSRFLHLLARDCGMSELPYRGGSWLICVPVTRTCLPQTDLLQQTDSCYTEIKVSGKTCCLTQSLNTYTRPINPITHSINHCKIATRGRICDWCDSTGKIGVRSLYPPLFRRASYSCRALASKRVAMRRCDVTLRRADTWVYKNVAHMDVSKHANDEEKQTSKMQMTRRSRRAKSK